MNDNDPAAGKPNERFVKATFAAMALGSVLVGLAIYLFHAAIGIDEDTARILSTALLVVGIGDTLLLYLWDRIFKRGGPGTNVD